MKHLLWLFLLSVILLSCSAKIPYVSDYPMSGDIFHSRDGTLTGRIPVGWFVSVNDTLAPALAVWLMKDDLSATLTIRELLLDSVTARLVRKEGLELLAAVSAGDRGLAVPNLTERMQEFVLGKTKYCSYEIGSGTDHRRVVVFSASGKYYECETGILGGKWDSEEISRLNIVQQSVLFSLVF